MVIKFLAFFTLCFVFFVESDGLEYETAYRRHDCGCQCDRNTFLGKFGRSHYNCKHSNRNGGRWCFVSSDSTCRDKIYSGQIDENGKPRMISAEACTNPLCYDQNELENSDLFREDGRRNMEKIHVNFFSSDDNESFLKSHDSRSDSSSIENGRFGANSHGGSVAYKENVNDNNSDEDIFDLKRSVSDDSITRGNSFHGRKGSYNFNNAIEEKGTFSDNGMYSGSNRKSNSYGGSSAFDGSGTAIGSNSESNSFGGSGSYGESDAFTESNSYGGSGTFTGSNSESNSYGGSGTLTGSNGESNSYGGSDTFTNSNGESNSYGESGIFTGNDGGSGVYGGSGTFTGGNGESNSYGGSGVYGGSGTFTGGNGESNSYGGSGTFTGGNGESNSYGGSGTFTGNNGESNSYGDSGTFTGNDGESNSYGGSTSFDGSETDTDSNTGSNSYGGSGIFGGTLPFGGSGTYVDSSSESNSYGGSGSFLGNGMYRNSKSDPYGENRLFEYRNYGGDGYDERIPFHDNQNEDKTSKFKKINNYSRIPSKLFKRYFK